MPSAPFADRGRREVVCEGVVPCQRPVRKRDLAPPRNAELVPEHVGVGLCRARGYAEPVPDLLVRQARSDQLHHLPLPVGEREAPGFVRLRHGAEASDGFRAGVLTGRSISPAYAATLRPRTKLASCPRAFASSSSSCVSAPMRSSRSNSSRRCVRIISGPSVAIVKRTPFSTKLRKTSRTASSSGSDFVSRFEVGQIS